MAPPQCLHRDSTKIPASGSTVVVPTVTRPASASQPDAASRPVGSNPRKSGSPAFAASSASIGPSSMSYGWLALYVQAKAVRRSRAKKVSG